LFSPSVSTFTCAPVSNGYPFSGTGIYFRSMGLTDVCHWSNVGRDCRQAGVSSDIWFLDPGESGKIGTAAETTAGISGRIVLLADETWSWLQGIGWVEVDSIDKKGEQQAGGTSCSIAKSWPENGLKSIWFTCYLHTSIGYWEAAWSSWF
jgi:hypothetical protein